MCDIPVLAHDALDASSPVGGSVVDVKTVGREDGTYKCAICDEDELQRHEVTNAAGKVRPSWRCKKCNAAVQRMNNAAAEKPELASKLKELKRHKEDWKVEVLRARDTSASRAEIQNYMQRLSSTVSCTKHRAMLELDRDHYAGYCFQWYGKLHEEGRQEFDTLVHQGDAKRVTRDGVVYLLKEAPRESWNDVQVSASREVTSSAQTLADADSQAIGLKKLEAGTRLQTAGAIFKSAGSAVFFEDAAEDTAGQQKEENTRTLKRAVSDDIIDPIAKSRRLASDPFVQRQHAVMEKTMFIKRTKEILSSIKSIGKSSKRLEQHTKPEFLEECGLTALIGRESSEVAVVTEALRTLETTSNSVIVDTLATLKDLVKDCDARNAALHFALENVKQESKRLFRVVDFKSARPALVRMCVCGQCPPRVSQCLVQTVTRCDASVSRKLIGSSHSVDSQLDSWRPLESGAAQHCTFETF